PQKDEKIFGEGYGPVQIISAGLSEDGRYLVITILYGSSGDKSEVWVQNVAEKGEIKPIAKDLPAQFSPSIAGDKMYMQTNWDAPNNRLLVVDLKNPAKENWKTVIPESESVMSGFSLVGGKIFVDYLENVSSRLKVFDPSGKEVREIKFPTVG